MLPKNTKGRLYFSNQEGLDASRNKVQSRPKIGKFDQCICIDSKNVGCSFLLLILLLLLYFLNYLIIIHFDASSYICFRRAGILSRF